MQVEPGRGNHHHEVYGQDDLFKTHADLESAIPIRRASALGATGSSALRALAHVLPSLFKDELRTGRPHADLMLQGNVG